VRRVRAHFVRVRAISAGELKEELSARGLDTSGKKAELVVKLREALEKSSSTATAAALPELPLPEPSSSSSSSSSGGGGRACGSDRACDIFFSFRLDEALIEAMELQAMIERTRPDVKCFLSGDNPTAHPNGANLGIIIPTAITNAKMAIVMGSKTYGKKTESNFSTYQEMQIILIEEKPMFLLKMCEEWEEPQTRLMMSSRKYKRWEDGQVTQALVDEILMRYDEANRIAQTSLPHSVPPGVSKGKQKAEPDADVEDEAPAAKKPKGKQKAEPVRPTIAPEAVAKMSIGALALASCLPAVKLL
jgi:hypothetical protein